MSNFNKIEEVKKQISEIKNNSRRGVFSVKHNQQKLDIKLIKKKAKTIRKISNDIKVIQGWINEIKEDETLKIISNKIDSPNILQTVIQNYKIKEIFISTWAITDVGLLALKEMQSQGIKVHVILDITHSYKWTFQSGANKLLKDVNFIFTDNHSKFQVFLLEDGSVLNFVGSFNLSNNPRYENIEITKDFEDYKFYSNFVLSVFKGENDTQKQMF